MSNETKTPITDGAAIDSFQTAKLNIVAHFDLLWLRQDNALAARRYSLGVSPVNFRNALVNELVSQKPTRLPICVTESAGIRNRLLARSIRRAQW